MDRNSDRAGRAPSRRAEARDHRLRAGRRLDGDDVGLDHVLAFGTGADDVCRVGQIHVVGTRLRRRDFELHFSAGRRGHQRALDPA